MEHKYNQFTAMFAIAKASLKATFRSPSSVFFSLGFPLVFIFVFGFVGSGSGISVDVAMAKTADTTSTFYKVLQQVHALHIVNKPDSEIHTDLRNGDITALIDIEKKPGDSLYTIQLTSSNAVNPQNVQIV
ncbi:MAG TPA: hypothetical protein VHB48_01260, partial [Chitinophagaceae bacterium]|nr:hypothetical protein [Chitinophagaceae bacterium]